MQCLEADKMQWNEQEEIEKANHEKLISVDYLLELGGMET